MTDFLVCPVCGRKLKMITSQHIHTHGYSVAEFKEKFNLSFLQPESRRRKHSARMLGNRNPNAGQRHSPEVRKKISENRTGKGIGVAGKYERTPEIRAKISKGVSRSSRNFARGRVETRFGFLPYKSTWERRVLSLSNDDPRVTFLDYETVEIPYRWDGQIKLYLPDIEVHFEGCQREIWEVKPEELQCYLKNEVKHEELLAWALQNGYNAQLVGMCEILKMENFYGVQSS